MCHADLGSRHGLRVVAWGRGETKKPKPRSQHDSGNTPASGWQESLSILALLFLGFWFSCLLARYVPLSTPWWRLHLCSDTPTHVRTQGTGARACHLDLRSRRRLWVERGGGGAQPKNKKKQHASGNTPASGWQEPLSILVFWFLGFLVFMSPCSLCAVTYSWVAVASVQ